VLRVGRIGRMMSGSPRRVAQRLDGNIGQGNDRRHGILAKWMI